MRGVQTNKKTLDELVQMVAPFNSEFITQAAKDVQWLMANEDISISMPIKVLETLLAAAGTFDFPKGRAAVTKIKKLNEELHEIRSLHLNYANVA